MYNRRCKPLLDKHKCNCCITSTEPDVPSEASERLAERIRLSIAAQSKLLAKLDDICKSMGDLTTKANQTGTRSYSAESPPKSHRVHQALVDPPRTDDKHAALPTSSRKYQMGPACFKTISDFLTPPSGSRCRPTSCACKRPARCPLRCEDNPKLLDFTAAPRYSKNVDVVKSIETSRNRTGQVQGKKATKQATRTQSSQLLNQRTTSLWESKDTRRLEADGRTGCQPFKAQPLPVHMFRTEYRLTRQAEEEVRKVCIKARAEEMLKCSSSPFSERKCTFTRVRSAQHLGRGDACGSVGGGGGKEVESGYKDNGPERARSGNPPGRRKPRWEEPTATAKRRSTSCPPAEEFRWKRFARPAPRVPRTDVKLNATAQLRQYHARQLRAREERLRRESDRVQLTRQRCKTELQRQMARFMAERCTTDGSRIFKEKLRSYRMTALQRNEEYQRELKEMDDRIRQKPLLIEKQALHCARQQLENKYLRKLREVGLDPEFLESKAAMLRVRSASLGSGSGRSVGRRSSLSVRDDEDSRRSPTRSLGNSDTEGASEREGNLALRAERASDPEKSEGSGSSRRTFTAESPDS